MKLLGIFRLQNGMQIRFWEDIWLGSSTLREEYPNLYNIVRRKNDTAFDILSTPPLNISFRRSLVDQNQNDWNSLVVRIVDVHLNDQHDVFRWSLNTSGQFSVRSMYNAMIDVDIMPHNIFLSLVEKWVVVPVGNWF